MNVFSKNNVISEVFCIKIQKILDKVDKYT